MGASHSADLELAQRCAAGDPAAWDRFVLEYRPVLYRAADALDPTGGAREIADSLYAELFGIRGSDTAADGRQSLFRYFQGRSSLATWLRAVLAQRYVDRLRAWRRLDPLTDERAGGDGPLEIPGLAAPPAEPDPERPRRMALVAAILARVVAALQPRDRLRLASYYVQQDARRDRPPAAGARGHGLPSARAHPPRDPDGGRARARPGRSRPGADRRVRQLRRLGSRSAGSGPAVSRERSA